MKLVEILPLIWKKNIENNYLKYPNPYSISGLVVTAFLSLTHSRYHDHMLQYTVVDVRL